MSAELRKLFEKQLQEYLKQRFKDRPDIKVNRNELVIKSKDAVGRMGFQYVTRAQGYTLSQSVSHPALLEFCMGMLNPEEPESVLEYVFAMNTSMEAGFKSFAINMGGTVDLPRNDVQRAETCAWIEEKLEQIYLPRLMNLLLLKPEAIDDITAHPEYYFYPFPMILYLIQHNRMSEDKLNMELLLSKRVQKQIIRPGKPQGGSRAHNKQLLEDVLRANS